nr:hypothetical protein [Chondromyces apiculatus]
MMVVDGALRSSQWRQLGQFERLLSVAAVGGAEEAEERVVLRDLPFLSFAGSLTLWNHVAGEACDRTKELIHETVLRFGCDLLTPSTLARSARPLAALLHRSNGF